MDAFIQNKLFQVAQYVEQLGYYPVFVALHGSQNYGLEIFTEEYQSDYDYKCIVLPTLQDLVKNSKPVSFVVKYEDVQIDIKDIRIFMETLLKMNPSYLEILFTPYSVFLSEGHRLGRMKELLPYLMEERGSLFAKAVYGMFLEKEKAMCHLYPTTAYKIERYGYDGKQTHHMYRLLLMLRDFEKTGTMILHPPESEVQFLIDLKLNRYPVEKALVMVDQWKLELYEIRLRLEDKYKNVKSDAANRMIDMSRSAVFSFCCTEKGRSLK